MGSRRETRLVGHLDAQPSLSPPLTEHRAAVNIFSYYHFTYVVSPIHLIADGDDSTKETNSKILSVIGPGTAGGSGGHLELGH